MESFWATLKTELIDRQIYATHPEAKRALFPYIEVFPTTASDSTALSATKLPWNTKTTRVKHPVTPHSRWSVKAWEDQSAMFSHEPPMGV